MLCFKTYTQKGMMLADVNHCSPAHTYPLQGTGLPVSPSCVSSAAPSAPLLLPLNYFD